MSDTTDEFKELVDFHRTGFVVNLQKNWNAMHVLHYVCAINKLHINFYLQNNP